MAGRLNEKSVKETPDKDMLQNLDLLLSMDVIEEEENWDVPDEEELPPARKSDGESNDKT